MVSMRTWASVSPVVPVDWCWCMVLRTSESMQGLLLTLQGRNIPAGVDDFLRQVGVSSHEQAFQLCCGRTSFGHVLVLVGLPARNEVPCCVMLEWIASCTQVLQGGGPCTRAEENLVHPALVCQLYLPLVLMLVDLQHCRQVRLHPFVPNGIIVGVLAGVLAPWAVLPALA